jgi:hypothetical protein
MKKQNTMNVIAAKIMKKKLRVLKMILDKKFMKIKIPWTSMIFDAMIIFLKLK